MNTERTKFNFYSDYRLFIDGLEQRLDLVIAERNFKQEKEKNKLKGQGVLSYKK